jgi:hypothetical protein
MKKFFISLFVLGMVFTSLNAQWQPTGEVEWSGAGGIYSLAVNGTYLFAGGTAGIFLSTNNGTNWTSANTGLANRYVYSLAVSGNNICAGTFNGISLSTNNGTSWSTVVTEGWITSFATKNSNIYASSAIWAADDSVYLSTDNGVSWHSKGSISATSLAVKDSILFSGGWVEWGGSGVHFSTDDGSSWQPTSLENENIWSLTVKDEYVIAGSYGSVFITSDNGENWTESSTGLPDIYIYSLTTNSLGYIFAGTGEGIFRSTNNGNSWTSINTGLTTNYFNALVVNGTDIFAGGYGVFRSTNNGNNWTAINEGMDPIVTSLAVENSVLFVASNGGRLFLSTNMGVYWVACDTGLGGIVNSLLVNGTNLYAGTGEGIFYSPDPYAPYWLPINNGLTNKQLLSLAFESYGVGNNNFFAGTYGSGVFRSTNNGSNWTAANSGMENSIVWALTAIDSNIFAGTGIEGVFHSNDNGTNWTTVNTGLSEADVRCFTQCDSFIFAGTWGSGVFRTSKNDISWGQVNSGLTDLCILSLYTMDTVIFAATYSGVFLSADFGISWISFNSGLENMDAWSFNVLGEYVYAGTSTGQVMKRPLSEIITDTQSQLSSAPTEFLLSNNFPNPFNPSTKIKYSIPQSSNVVIKIFDVLGNEIETLVNEEKPTGTYELMWNAANLPSGVYFYQLKACSFVQTKKMILLK